jgi:hypothetical protein
MTIASDTSYERPVWPSFYFRFVIGLCIVVAWPQAIFWTQSLSSNEYFALFSIIFFTGLMFYLCKLVNDIIRDNSRGIGYWVLTIITWSVIIGTTLRVLLISYFAVIGILLHYGLI